MRNKLYPLCRLRGRFSSMLGVAAAVCFSFAGLHAEEDYVEDPFQPSITAETRDGAASLTVRFPVPPGHHLYRDRIGFSLGDERLAVDLPPGSDYKDPRTGELLDVYESGFAVSIPFVTGVLAVDYQGCNEESCFFPQSRRFQIGESGITLLSEDEEFTTEPDIVSSDPGTLLTGFEVSRRASGFMGSEKMVGFLEGSDKGRVAAEASIDRFKGWGRLLIVGGILLGGLALNLTPCVLPMIPINLAIMGAGSNRASRRRGFLLGGTYGAAMMLVYGVLGLVVVLTGAKFGSLNSSPWFNLGIAVVFIVLGLAMFDRIAIDLSRFTGGGGSRGASGNNWLLAASMGGVAALLAGACVAPVVISVLLLSTSLHQAGIWMGLALPFILGLGMALPWPFAGAGLTFLPKPGAWMKRVKQGFGVFIFAFAAWYGCLAVKLLDAGPLGSTVGTQTKSAVEDNVEKLRSAFAESRATGRPVLVDFWASWCKNCEAMEATTYRNEEVRAKLRDFILVKFQAERLGDPALKDILDEFGVMGLPTCVVVEPQTKVAKIPNTFNASNL